MQENKESITGTVLKIFFETGDFETFETRGERTATPRNFYLSLEVLSFGWASALKRPRCAQRTTRQ